MVLNSPNATAGLANSLTELFTRDLLKLAEEIRIYPSEESIWRIPPGVSNSAGTLCLHLVGNLQHFIGMALGHSGYARDREREFSDRNVPRDSLLAGIEGALEAVKNTFAALPETAFSQDFPLEKHGEIVRTDYMLLHLLTHLNYHLGQVNYHRRLVCA